jgi:uncharacterized protein
MKIYAVADIHGKKFKIDQIEEHIRIHRPDTLILAGDLTHYFFGKKTLAAYAEMVPRILAVRGNSDCLAPEINFMASKIINLHMVNLEFEGIRFAGIGGCIPLPFWSKFKLFEKKIAEKMHDLIDEDTILVTHIPPRGTRDEVLGKAHAGSRLLKNIVLQYQPRMVICGHIHEQAGTAQINNTLIVNCSIYKKHHGALIEIDKHGTQKVTMLSG